MASACALLVEPVVADKETHATIQQSLHSLGESSVIDRSRLRLPDRAASAGRFDIQGLRAFAVIAVILDHLLGWPDGGFVGVDVFFVISGFLITGILLREHEKTNHISFTGFYRRRIKRIIPAAVLVLTATVAGAWFVFDASRVRTTLVDATWAFLFAGNWRFASLSTDYFSADGPVSPLQHYWSLAVEEQFYFVWPWIMLLIFTLFLRGQRSLRSARIVVGAVITMVSVASFVWALWETAIFPNSAYFSTFSRAWELGVGALLAVAAPALINVPSRLRPLLAWLGIVGMVASLFLIHQGSAFPAPAAALPVLSAALVILSGTGVEQQQFLFPLTNRVSSYVGDISYSLYLWHFPIIILGGAIVARTPLTQTVIGVVIVITAVYSYQLVENPIRLSNWLSPSGRRREVHLVRRDRASARFPALDQPYKVTALSCVCIVTVALVALALKPVAPPKIVVLSPPKSQSSRTATPQDVSPEQAALQKQIVTALRATSWPSLDPTMSDAIGSPQAPPDILSCGAYPLVDSTKCTWGDSVATKTAIIVGDSAAMTYVNPLRKILGANGWQLKSYGTFGCPFTDRLIPTPDANITRTCTARKADAVKAIKQAEPDLVFITNSYIPKSTGGNAKLWTTDEWETSTLRIVNKFKDSVGKVVFLAAPPSDKDLAACYTRLSKPFDCVSKVLTTWDDFAVSDQDMAAKVQGAWVDSRPWFCVYGSCPSFVGHTPTKSDRNHMTIAYGQWIAPVIEESLKTRKIL